MMATCPHNFWPWQRRWVCGLFACCDSPYTQRSSAALYQILVCTLESKFQRYLGSHRPYCSVELLSGSPCLLYRRIFNLGHCMPCTGGLVSAPKHPCSCKRSTKARYASQHFVIVHIFIQHKIIVKSEFSCVATVLGTEGNHHVCWGWGKD